MPGRRELGANHSPSPWAYSAATRQVVQILRERPLPLDFLAQHPEARAAPGHTFDPPAGVFGQLVQEALDMAPKDR